MTNEQLLAEIEEILRTIPSGTSFATYGTEGLSWLGRATAVIEAWDALKGTVSRAPRTLTSSISPDPAHSQRRSLGNRYTPRDGSHRGRCSADRSFGNHDDS